MITVIVKYGPLQERIGAERPADLSGIGADLWEPSISATAENLWDLLVAIEKQYPRFLGDVYNAKSDMLRRGILISVDGEAVGRGAIYGSGVYESDPDDRVHPEYTELIVRPAHKLNQAGMKAIRLRADCEVWFDGMLEGG